MNEQNENLPLLDAQQEALAALEEVASRVRAGEILSVVIIGERTDGDYFCQWSPRENAFSIGGYMIHTALRQMGFRT